MTDTQAFTLRLPQDVYDSLRSEAFWSAPPNRQSMNAIIIDALRLRASILGAEAYGQLCGLFDAAWQHVVPDSLDDLLPMTSDEARKFALLAMEAVSK